MSVRTEADEHLDHAKLSIGNALSDINEIVVLRCSGWDEFTDLAKLNLRELHSKLLEARDLADGP